MPANWELQRQSMPGSGAVNPVSLQLVDGVKRSNAPSRPSSEGDLPRAVVTHCSPRFRMAGRLPRACEPIGLP